MLRAIKAASALTTAAVLFTGGVAGASSISYTGPHSYNTISSNYCNKQVRRTYTNVVVWTSNNQWAQSGNAYSWGNTIGGGVRSGNASNYNNTSVRIDL